MGKFVSVRRHVDWQAGRYTYFLRRSKLTNDLWFTASVRELESGEETEIGSLRFDATDRSLAPPIAAFVEIYGSTSVTPQLTIIFSEPRVDGSRRPGTRTTITYPRNGADGLLRFATASQSGERVIVKLEPAGLRNSLERQRGR